MIKKIKIKIKIGKRYRSGETEVRILCIDAPGEFPVIALDKNGEPFRYTYDGVFCGGIKRYNLIEIRPEEKEVVMWTTVSEAGHVAGFYPLKEIVNGPYRRIVKLTGKYTLETDDGKD